MNSLDFKNLEKQMCYLHEENRLASYKSKWVFPDEKVCNASKMAEAGFVYIGTRHEPDAVKCFMCGKCLDGWDADDDPWSEHLKHSKACSFAKLQQPEDTLTFKQFLEIRDELHEILVKKILEEKKEELKDLFDNLKKKIYNL